MNFNNSKTNWLRLTTLLLSLILAIPSFAGEETVDGQSAEGHIIQGSGVNFPQKSVLNFATGLTVTTVASKTTVTAAGLGAADISATAPANWNAGTKKISVDQASAGVSGYISGTVYTSWSNAISQAAIADTHTTGYIPVWQNTSNNWLSGGIANDSTNWGTAYTDRLKWDGGSTGLVAGTGRTSLGLGTIATMNTVDYKMSNASLTSFVDQNNWMTFYSNGSGDVTELSLGAAGKVLTSNGESSAPTWETPTGGYTAPRVTSVASATSPTINAATTDQYNITALAATITTVSVSGSPATGQKLVMRVKDNGTAFPITWGASFASIGVATPTTTTAGKVSYFGFIYNDVTSTFDLVASVTKT